MYVAFIICHIKAETQAFLKWKSLCNEDDGFEKIKQDKILHSYNQFVVRE